MFHGRLKNWLKALSITFLVMLSISMLGNFTSSALAQPSISPELTIGGTGGGKPVIDDRDPSLSEGGFGLAIPTGDVKISESISQKKFGETLITMVNYFTGFLGFLATLSFVYAGVLWVVSGGNEESIGKAKKIMTYAALGIIVVILSYSAVSFIASSAGGEVGVEPTGGECQSNLDCKEGKKCLLDNSLKPPEFRCMTFDTYACENDLHCPPGFVCDDTSEPSRCVPSERPGVVGSTSIPAVTENMDVIDDLMDGLEDALDIDGLSDEVRDKVEDFLVGDDLDGKISNIQDMLGDPDLSPSDVRILERLVDGLERLKSIKQELEELEENMPKSDETIAAFGDTSEALDNLIAEPTSSVLFGRFDSKYKKLKDLIRKFPVVQARIRAFPGEGNVPFTVQFDGLDSIDPTGGTIGQYNWTLFGNRGEEIPLGTDSVVIHEFTEPNNYAVRLQVATSQLDEGLHKTAMDGISTVRVRANPPASDVRFRINGKEVFDVFHATLKEAQAGLSFDPSPTTPALGRTIEKYEWSYGDTTEETRNVPTTVVHTYTDPGEYFAKLVVTDNLGIKDRRIVKIFVKALAAEIVIKPTSGSVNTEFNFEGERSRSDDGIIKDYEWEIRDGGRVIYESDEDSFYHRFDQPGEYEITLVITDITNATDKVVKALEVLSRPPIANYNFTFPEENHPNLVEFNAIDSYDPDDGDVITYSWDFDGDGTFELVNSDQALTTHEFGRVGEYRTKLQIEDAFGKRDQIEKKVSVQSVLSADIVMARRATRVGEPIELSVDSPNAVAYLWEYGDGETYSTEETTASHTYDKTGKFTVKLNFFDEKDNDNFDVARILVGVGDEPMAVVNTVVNGREPHVIEDLCRKDEEGILVNRADKIRLDGKSSINTDGSSRLLSYDWKFPDGQKSSSRETSYKFDEINREGECFSISLVVRDQLTGKLSTEDEIFFKVINQLPQLTDFVITPPDGTEELVTPVKIKLKAVNTKDLDGTIKKYKWWYFNEGFEEEKLGVHSTATPETEMVITSFGESDITNRYFFVLEVVDSDGGVYSSEERFGEVSYLDVKNGPNLSPVAEFTMDKTTISVGDSITFISKSYDPQGDELANDAFRWDFDGDGEFDDISTGPQVNRQYNTPGEYEVRLKVVHRGLSSSATKVVFVEPTNSLPQAAFTYQVDDNTVSFNGTSTRFDPDLDDTTLRFEWDFDIAGDANGNGIKDDDVESTETETTFTYPEKRLYRVKLTVKDTLGMIGVVVRDVDLTLTEAERQKKAYHSLSVSAPRHPLTSLDLEVVPATLDKGGTADISVRVLNADSSPYKGQVFFEILDGSGEFTPNPVDAVDSKASSIFSATDSGKIRIQVRATGTLHDELTEEATITVK